MEKVVPQPPSAHRGVTMSRRFPGAVSFSRFGLQVDVAASVSEPIPRTFPLAYARGYG